MAHHFWWVWPRTALVVRMGQQAAAMKVQHARAPVAVRDSDAAVPVGFVRWRWLRLANYDDFPPLGRWGRTMPAGSVPV